MDRGVKIAIFAACIASLSLGLIWDQVLSGARGLVEKHADDPLGPDLTGLRMGSPEIGRSAIVPAPEHQPAVETPRNEPREVVESQPTRADTASSPDSQPLEHVLLPGENPWKLAHGKFKDRKLTSDDLLKANPGNKWREGDKVIIPPAKT